MRLTYELAERISQSRRCLPKLLEDPQRIVHWLSSARRAHLVAGALLVFGLFVMPLLRDTMLSVAYPPVRSGGVFGIGATKRVNPRSHRPRALLTLTYWGASTGVVALMLWLHIPAALSDRRQRGRTSSPPSAPDSNVGPKTLDAGAARTMLAEPVGPSAAPLAPMRYRIERPLGQGAMGVVSLAHDQVLDRLVALKEIPPIMRRDAGVIERFRREARALAKLNHPHIVQVFDLVENESGLWMAMEWVDGSDLERFLRERGVLSEAEVVTLGLQFCDALGYAHARGVVHRDFKPQNILMTADGGAKVTDFGLAKLAHDPRLTQDGSVLGTPAYMSPEQVQGLEADARSDLYALGITLYELATGSVPFDGSPTSILVRHVTEPPTSPRVHVPALSSSLERLVLSLLEKDPAMRPSDARAVYDGLEACRASSAS